MSDVRKETAALLDDRPEFGDNLRALLDTDRQQDAWTFDDAPVDSGTFGELVARGVVVKTDAGYRLADPHAVRVALGDADPEESAAGAGALDRLRERTTISTVSGRLVAALFGSLLVVAAFRAFVYPRVFRGEHVVLLANDPYYYRYLVRSMLEGGAGMLDVPASIETGEPLLVALLVAATRALGGTPETADLVLAWYPVIMGLGSAVLCYVLAVTLSRDRRVGLASVLVLAALPVHAYRTTLGFADHHALDFLWLAFVALAAVRTLPGPGTTAARIDWRSRLPWAGVLAVGIAAQTHSWNAAPLLVVPFVAYAVTRSATLVHAEDSLLADVSLVVGVGAGGLLAFAGHVVLGWQSLVIVAAPVLAAVAMAFAIGMAAVVRRVSLPAWSAAVFATAAGLLTLWVAVSVQPSFGAELSQEFSRLVGMSGSEIAETKSLFSTQYGLFAGPIFFYGTALVFALPAGAWAFYYGVRRPRWLLAASYGLVLFGLAITQVRFAGELAVFVALFAGFAFVYFLAVLDIAAPPAVFAERNPRSDSTPGVRSVSVPNGSTLLYVGLAFLFVSGLGIMVTPVRTNTLVASENTYEAAAWMSEAVESPDWTSDQTYVFSQWGQNRLYNAFVSGNSRSYGYARSNYESFLAANDSQVWYERLRGRAGFVVVDDNHVSENATETIGAGLTDRGSGLGHYQAVWTSGSKTIYTLVPGATITGEANTTESVTVTHEGVVAGEQFTYERTTTVTNGTFSVRVPYAGTYDVAGTALEISEEAVNSGNTVNVSAT